MDPRIIPLNLPAELDREIPGNPVSSRPESAIANCYPGLEVDVRNLDRRFFPGLVFDFVAQPDDGSSATMRGGALLVEVDPSDPDLPKDRPDLKKSLTSLQKMMAVKSVFLDSITAGQGKCIKLHDGDGHPYDWDVTWRIVRSTPPGSITIELVICDGVKKSPLMTLQADRRQYQNKDGELSQVYRPGELSQALCSPWQHDFRDCACTYWASNHPDIVLPAHPASVAETLDPGPLAERAEDPVIWMRWDRTGYAAPRPTADSCGPFEIDHYEINDRWRDLDFVLAGREHPAPWSIEPEELGPALDPGDLDKELKRLAGIEHALALEYLYARYSVRFDDPALTPEDQGSADFIAHELLVIAISEMMHLRWVNQIIWELNNHGFPHLKPALSVADKVPAEERPRFKRHRSEVSMRETEMRPIDVAIDDFIGAEAPSGTIVGQYAHLLALFRQDNRFPPDLIGLVERIIADGVTHYSRFREMKALLNRPHSAPLVRPNFGGKSLTKATSPQDVTLPDGARLSVGFEDFVRLYRDVLENLRSGYSTGRAEDRAFIIKARLAMTEFDRLATALANEGWAVPLLDVEQKARLT